MATGKYSRIVARNVLRRIEQLDLTRQEVSRRSGVSVSLLSNIVRELANPSLGTLEDLAAALETTVPSLLVEPETLPPGCERVTLVLPKEHVAAVTRLAAEAERQLKKLRS
jgi:transcriptional regulator with XRE-family HTH domain